MAAPRPAGASSSSSQEHKDDKAIEQRAIAQLKDPSKKYLSDQQLYNVCLKMVSRPEQMDVESLKLIAIFSKGSENYGELRGNCIARITCATNWTTLASGNNTTLKLEFLDTHFKDSIYVTRYFKDRIESLKVIDTYSDLYVGPIHILKRAREQAYASSREDKEFQPIYTQAIDYWVENVLPKLACAQLDVCHDLFKFLADEGRAHSFTANLAWKTINKMLAYWESNPSLIHDILTRELKRIISKYQKYTPDEKYSDVTQVGKILFRIQAEALYQPEMSVDESRRAVGSLMGYKKTFKAIKEDFILDLAHFKEKEFATLNAFKTANANEIIAAATGKKPKSQTELRVLLATHQVEEQKLTDKLFPPPVREELDKIQVIMLNEYLFAHANDEEALIEHAKNDNMLALSLLLRITKGADDGRRLMLCMKIHMLPDNRDADKALMFTDGTASKIHFRAHGIISDMPFLKQRVGIHFSEIYQTMRKDKHIPAEMKAKANTDTLISALFFNDGSDSKSGRVFTIYHRCVTTLFGAINNDIILCRAMIEKIKDGLKLADQKQPAGLGTHTATLLAAPVPSPDPTPSATPGADPTTPTP